MNWDQRVAPSALRVLTLIKWGAGQSTPANPASRASTLRQGLLHAHPAPRVSIMSGLEQLPAHHVLQARNPGQVLRMNGPVRPALEARTLIRRVVSANPAVRARLPPLIEKAADPDPALRERTLRRGLGPAHPALQAPTVSSRDSPPAPPAQAAKEAFPVAAPA